MIRQQWKFVAKFDQLRKATQTATRKWLYRVGGYMRTTARRSLKLATKKRSDEELTDYELDRWVMLNAWRERRGLETPTPYPDRVSAPGKPPLLHERNSPLKRLLNFHVDVEAAETQIGPERAKSAVAWKLEEGHGRIRSRPFMEPAQRATQPHMAKWWHDAIAA